MTTTMDRRNFLARSLTPLALAALGVSAVAATPKVPVQVFKSPSCGCCKDWVTHLEAHGFSVQVFDTGNTDARERFKMPVELGSCHTAWVGGYAIEGHVPAKDIQRLLKDKPRPSAWPCRACRSARQAWMVPITAVARIRTMCCSCWPTARRASGRPTVDRPP
jgi:hypothetical protein